MGTYNTGIYPASPGLALGRIGQEWAAVLQNLSASGDVDLLQAVSLLRAKKLNNVLFADQYDGIDIGDQVNAAYADLPAGGGTIYIAPKDDGSTYDFSTPIVCNTLGKFVRIEGLGVSGIPGAGSSTGVTLNYTGVSGSAVNLDYVPDFASASGCHGLRNLTLINNNHSTTGSYTGSAVGIEIGMANDGILGGSMDNVSIIGFPIAFLNTNNRSVQIYWSNPQFFANGIAFQLGAITGFFIFGGQIAGNSTGFKASGPNATPLIQIFGTSFFGNGIIGDFTALSGLGTNAEIDCVAAHFETSINQLPFFDGAIILRMFGGVMEDASGVAIPYFIRSNGDFIGIYGTTLKATSTVATVISATANVRGIISTYDGSPGHFTAYVSGANAGNFTQNVFVGPSTVAAGTWTFESALAAPKISIAGELVSSSPREIYSGYIAAGNKPANTYFRTILDKPIIVSRVIINAATPEAGVGTHCVVRITDGTTNLDTTFVDGTQVYDSGAISQVFAGGALLDMKINTASVGGTPATDIGITVEYRME